MAQKTARMLAFLILTVLTCSLPCYLFSDPVAVPGDAASTVPTLKPNEQLVFLGKNLSSEKLLTLSAAMAASGRKDILLVDSPSSTRSLQSFLAALRPDRVIPVGSFPEGQIELQRRLPATVAPAIGWGQGPPRDLWRLLLLRVENVVVCPAEPRSQLLQAACLAGVIRAPLFVTHGNKHEADELRSLLRLWQARQIFAVGVARQLCRRTTPGSIVFLKDEEAVAASYVRYQQQFGPMRTLVVANPADEGKEKGGMSALAPWIALQHRAALLLTNPSGNNVEAVVEAATRHRALHQADALIYVANLKAIPMQRRPNPIPTDKDEYIELEPMTPKGNEPLSFAIGRLFHSDLGIATLLLGRERLLANVRLPRKALVASNPGGGLPLLETFSRSTANELRNVGYETTALFRDQVSKEKLQKLLPGCDIFLWEGHHSTLIREYKIQEWKDPLPPSLIFLQSCLALTEEKTHPLLDHGAIAVIGCTSRTYSASGGACSLAFFNSLLYDGQSLGGSLRQAKNFLLAYMLLKEKRLGAAAKRSGANMRAVWAFSLWGDPTLKLPRPGSDTRLPPVHHSVTGNSITIHLPNQTHDPVNSTKYRVAMPANGRLAGLVRKDDDEDYHPLVPFVFVEVHLPKARAGRVPELTSRLPSRHWIFRWDARRSCGYLLAIPRAKDINTLQFHVRWKNAESTRMVGTGASARRS